VSGINKIFLRLALFLPGGLLLLPLGFLVFKTLSVPHELFLHISEHLLRESIANTLKLLLGVLSLSLLVAFGAALIMGRFEFIGRKFFRWALLLPLALPAYVVSFIWISWFDFSGLIPTFLRSYSTSLGSLEIFSNFRSLAGLILPMSFCFFPYIYLLLLEAFERQNKHLSEVTRSMGLNRRQRIWRLHIPLLAPWMVSGLLLVGMETLADFGSVSAFNIPVFTTMLYRSWYALQSIETASLFALVHVAFLVIFVLLISLVLRGKRYTDKSGGKDPLPRTPLNKSQTFIVLFLLSSLFFISFLAPCLQLLTWVIGDSSRLWDSRLLSRVVNSFSIALMAGLVTSAMACGMILGKRFIRSPSTKWALRIGTLGYGIPGTVIAIGWVISLTLLIGPLHGLGQWALLALILGLSSRFITLALRPLESAVERVAPSIEESARSLGSSLRKIFFKIHFPLLKGAFSIGFLFVFVDTLKEMPMTLLMRPMGWDTLATQIYQFTAEGLWVEAAFPSLIIVLASIIPIFIMRKQIG
jgi:iron(III) transport system permease protein